MVKDLHFIHTLNRTHLGKQIPYDPNISSEELQKKVRVLI